MGLIKIFLFILMFVCLIFNFVVLFILCVLVILELVLRFGNLLLDELNWFFISEFFWVIFVRGFIWVEEDDDDDE